MVLGLSKYFRLPRPAAPSPYRVRRAGPSADLGFWQAPKNSARSTYPKSGQGGPKIYIMYLKNPSRYNRSFCKTESPIVSRVSNASSSSDFSEKSAPPLPGATISVPKLGQLGGRQQACQVPRREAPPDARGCYRGHGKACRVTLGGRRPCPDVSGGGAIVITVLTSRHIKLSRYRCRLRGLSSCIVSLLTLNDKLCSPN